GGASGERERGGGRGEEQGSDELHAFSRESWCAAHRRGRRWGPQLRGTAPRVALMTRNRSRAAIDETAGVSHGPETREVC
ncbi:MAG: hypothetical protein ACM3NW_10710, partial [Syntrophomonadaceae bacterium]